MKRHYGGPIVVFDGYLNGPSTEDTRQWRKTGHRVGVSIQVSGQQYSKGKNKTFSRTRRTSRGFLDGHFRQHGCRTQHARAGYDCLCKLPLPLLKTQIHNGCGCWRHRHSCSSLLPFKDVYVKLVSSSWTSIWNEKAAKMFGYQSCKIHVRPTSLWWVAFCMSTLFLAVTLLPISMVWE